MFGFDNRLAVLSYEDVQKQLETWRKNLARERSELEALQRAAAKKYGFLAPVDANAAAKASDGLDNEARGNGWRYREKVQRISEMVDLIAGLEQLAIVAEYRELLEKSDNFPDVKGPRKRRAELERDFGALLVAEGVLA